MENSIGNKTSSWSRLRKIMVVGGLTLFGLAAGAYLGSHQGMLSQAHAEEQSAAAALWTCPMHPNVKLEKQEPCPLCGMNLVPITKSETKETGGTMDSCCPSDKGALPKKSKLVEQMHKPAAKSCCSPNASSCEATN